MTKTFQRKLHDYVALHNPCRVYARWLPCFGYQEPAILSREGIGVLLHSIPTFASNESVGPPLPFQAARRQGGAREQQVEILMVTTLHVPCLLPL
jgi:hypothetical protein